MEQIIIQDHIDPETFAEIIKSAQSLAYGNVTLVIQANQVVQIHKTEKRKIKKLTRQTGG